MTQTSTLAADRIVVQRPPIWLGVLLGISAAAIWGGYMSLTRIGVSSGLNPADIAFVRFVPAGLVMLPWYLRHSPKTFAGIGVKRALLLAFIVGPIFLMLGASAFYFVPIAHGALFQPATAALGGMLLAIPVLGERPRTDRLVGVAIMIVGLALIAGPGVLAGDWHTVLGDFLAAAGGFMWAIFTVLLQYWRIPAIPATAAVAVISGAIYGPIFALTLGFSRLAALSLPDLAAQILVQGILSGAVATVAFGRAVAILGASRAAVFVALVPVIANLLAIPLVGEIPTLGQWLGIIVVTAGLFLALGIAPRAILKS